MRMAVSLKKNVQNVEKSGILLIKRAIFFDFTRDSRGYETKKN